MSNLFLRIKDWQFFIFVYVLPYVLIILFGGYMFYELFNDIRAIEAAGNQSSDYIMTVFSELSRIAKIITPIYLLSFFSFAWYWVLGNRLQEYIPKELRKNTTWFNILLILTLLIQLAPNFIGLYFLDNLSIEFFENTGDFESEFMLYNVLYYISLFCRPFHVYLHHVFLF